MTDLVLASKWHSSENRRREALKAAHQQDEATLGELLEAYLLLKSSRKSLISPKTLKSYRETLRKFLSYIGPAEAPKQSLLQLTAEDIEFWLLHMNGEQLKASSVQRHLCALRNLLKALVWAGVLKSDPSFSVKPPSDKTEAHNKKGALSLNMYQKLIALPKTMYPDHAYRIHRDTLLLCLGGSMGLRVAEICQLTCQDVDLNLKQVRVRGKGSKTRILPLTGTLIAHIKAWLESRTALKIQGKISCDALLVSFQPGHFGKPLSTNGARDIAARYYTALGLPLELFGMHTLRRTAGTHLYRATRDLHVVADLLGHANINTTAIYAKMDSEVRLEALEKLEALRQDHQG